LITWFGDKTMKNEKKRERNQGRFTDVIAVDDDKIDDTKSLVDGQWIKAPMNLVANNT